MKKMLCLLLVLMLPLAALAQEAQALPEGARLFEMDAETGYAIIETENGYGACDMAGRIIVECWYIQPFYFSEGFALLRGETFLYVDWDGRIIADGGWDYAFPFSGGYARVCMDGLYGLIDQSGAQVLPCAYAELGDAVDGVVYGTREDGQIERIMLPQGDEAVL